jgi:hypothetical protein
MFNKITTLDFDAKTYKDRTREEMQQIKQSLVELLKGIMNHDNAVIMLKQDMIDFDEEDTNLYRFGFVEAKKCTIEEWAINQLEWYDAMQLISLLKILLNK